MTHDEVFCKASEIEYGQCFEHEGKSYRRLNVIDFPSFLGAVAGVSEHHELHVIPASAIVRRYSNGFGSPLHTDEEEAAANESQRQYSLASDAIDDRVAVAIRKYRRENSLRPVDRILVDYSAYDSDDNDVPIDNLNDIAIIGKCILVMREDRPYQSEVVENPTWLQLAVLANEMIIATRDHHHCFLETVHKIKWRPKGLPEDVAVYEFGMGS